jgi:HD-GYP domain-containing protein (c-di-GMP phosphodiesterase class II)
MGGKKLSPQERLARLKQVQGQRGANFSGSKPPAEPIQVPAEEMAKPVVEQKAKPPPVPKADPVIEQPPQPMLAEVLQNMEAQDLLKFIQEVCRTEKISTNEVLAERHPDMAILAMKKGVLGQVFVKQGPAKSPDNATRNLNPNGAKMPSLPPIASMSTRARHDEDKVTSPESGAYDPTTAVEYAAVAEDTAALTRFMAELIDDENITSKEKHAKAEERYEKEYRAFVQKHGKEQANEILSSAKNKLKSGESLEPEEEFVIKLFELQRLVLKFLKISKSESEARVLQKAQAQKPPATHTTGPISFGSDAYEEIDMSEPGVPEAPKAENEEVVVLSQEQIRAPSEPPPVVLTQGGWFGRTFRNPTTWAFISISAYSAAMHITGAWDTICQGVGRIWHSIPHLPNIQLPEHVDKAIWYGAILLGFGVTELVRRRAVKKEVLRLERRSMLGKKAQENYSYVAQKLASVRLMTSDLSMQLIHLRAMMVNDENLFDAVDRLYRDELIWTDIMKESRLDDSEIIKKRLAQIVPFIKDNEHRKRKLKELFLTDQLFQRKIQEVFEQTAGGGYVNRDLREGLTSLKYDNPIPEEYQREFLRLLEEDYRIIQTDSDIHR